MNIFFFFLEGVLDLKTLSNRQWALIMKNAKYSLMSRCQNNSKCFSMEQKMRKGTIYTCEDVYKKKYRGVYFQKVCDNYHGTGYFDPFSEKFFTFKSKKSVTFNFYGNIYPSCNLLLNFGKYGGSVFDLKTTSNR